METILNYLENMFVNFPQTAEVLRAKADLAEMMEDKYNELIAEGKMENEAIGIVISEFGSIQELADELGIRRRDSGQYGSETMGRERQQDGTVPVEREKHQHASGFGMEGFEKKDGGQFISGFEKETKENRQHTPGPEMRHVSEMEAEEYFFAVKQSASKMAAGVFLCICSPILVLLLGGISECITPISDGVVGGVGVSVLLLMVACAVGLFISAGMKLEAYEYLKKECFTVDPELELNFYHLRESQRGKFSMKIIIGVVMCILSALPIMFAAIILENVSNEFPMVVSVVFLLVMVGVAVSLFITAEMEDEAYNVILQEKDFSIEKKSGKKIKNFISSIFWTVILAIYLCWSFVAGSWRISWIIWPLAGILFKAINEIIKMAEGKE